MTILTNKQIRELVDQGGLISESTEPSFQPCSYDMRIGSIFRDGQVVNGQHPRRDEQISLAPGEVITMTTLEELRLPADISATAYAINAQSSEGLLVLNPGHIDPGYEGTLTVMAINMRRVPYVVSRMDRIFTIVFQRLANPAQPPYSNRPGSRADKERDLNKKVVEKAVTSVGDLIALNSPFMRPEEVNRRIRNHWSTIATMIMAVITVVASIVAAIFAVAALFREDPPATARLIPATAPNTMIVMPSDQVPPSVALRRPQTTHAASKGQAESATAVK